MKNILSIIALVFASISSLQGQVFESIQEKALEKLLCVRNVNASEVPDISSPNICLTEQVTDKNLSYQMLNGVNAALIQSKSKKASNKMETHSVMVNNIDGYIFHVADYYGVWGNSRVVTCLNGDMRGLQGIADNGILMVESTDVKWHKNYFEHNYPAAKTYSYPNKQIFELK